jgi:acetyl esterase/lipase
MPVDVNFNFNFSAAEQGSINTGLDNVLAALNMPGVPYVNLTAEERKIPSIGSARLPYVHEAVDNILPLFPALASPSVGLPRTTTLLQLVGFLSSVAPKLKEINDRLTDLGINAENIVYKSMRHSYGTAQAQEGQMPGADVLIAALAPLFADQGGGNEEEPIPGPPAPPIPV